MGRIIASTRLARVCVTKTETTIGQHVHDGHAVWRHRLSVFVWRHRLGVQLLLLVWPVVLPTHSA